VELTVALIEAELLARLGPYLRRVGLDGTAADGKNSALRGPIRGAVCSLGLPTSDPIAVVDSDVAGVAGFALERLLDVAEMKALETCWGNWPEVDQQAGEERQDLSQLADRIERRIRLLSDRTAGPYTTGKGIGHGPAVSGLIRAGRLGGRMR
jgi:hypothetical protein